MPNELTPARKRTLRHVLVFAIVLAVLDVCLIGFLSGIGVLHLPY